MKRLVDQLERTLNPFAAYLAPLQKIVAPLTKSVRAIGDTRRITAPMERIPELEKQIAANMHPLKKLAASLPGAAKSKRALRAAA